MKISKPINISLEVVSFLILLLASLSNSLEATWFGAIDGFLVWGGFVLLVVYIMEKAIKKNSKERALPSVFLFGLLVGSFLWSIFIWTESKSEGLPIGLSAFFYVLMVGFCVAVVSLVFGYVYLRVRRSK